MKKKTKLCIICSTNISVSNYQRHTAKCIGPKEIKETSISKTFNFNGIEYSCKKCYRKFITKQSAGSHYWRSHTEKGRNHTPGLDCSNEPWNKGLTKETSGIVKLASEKAKMTLDKKGRVGCVHTKEFKENLSKIMKERHKLGLAWNIGMSRWNNKPSYPETFFMKVIENEFVDKEYKREMPFDRYSLDFAWGHKKKVIEIDGQQHERFEEQKLRDVNKDILLAAAGWQVLRIKWKDIFNDSEKFIKIAKDFIDM